MQTTSMAILLPPTKPWEAHAIPLHLRSNRLIVRPTYQNRCPLASRTVHSISTSSQTRSFLLSFLDLEHRLAFRCFRGYGVVVWARSYSLRPLRRNLMVDIQKTDSYTPPKICLTKGASLG